MKRIRDVSKVSRDRGVIDNSPKNQNTNQAGGKGGCHTFEMTELNEGYERGMWLEANNIAVFISLLQKWRVRVKGSTVLALGWNSINKTLPT